MTDLEIVKKALDIMEFSYDVDECYYDENIMVRMYYGDDENIFYFNPKGEYLKSEIYTN